MLGKKEYLSVDESTTIRVMNIENKWVEIQIGWIPIKKIRLGTSTKKMEGWIKQNCLVYNGKKGNNPIGTIAIPSAVGIADDGSGWLKIIHGPLKTLSKDKYLTAKEIGEDAYIESNNFTTEMPAKWNK